MENLLVRYRNTTILIAVLFVQIVGLAVQVKRPTEDGSTRLIRLWAINAITPLEKAAVGTGRWVRGLWSDYIYLRGMRQQNRALQEQIDRMRIEQVRLSEDANQARRLQTLLQFKEQFVSQTVAAQVIGSSGSPQSRVVYIDKGSRDGLQPDMAVITPDGVIGKVLRVFHASSQVLLMNDPTSGVGAVLEQTRLHGIVQGTASGEVVLRYIMSDEKITPGERVLTSGGDRIFPKGMPVGTVVQVTPGQDLFWNIRVKPAASLNRLEEVLVVTRIEETAPPEPGPEGPVRAADILAQRLPGITRKAEEPAKAAQPATPKPKPPSAQAAPPQPGNTNPSPSTAPASPKPEPKPPAQAVPQQQPPAPATPGPPQAIRPRAKPPSQAAGSGPS